MWVDYTIDQDGNGFTVKGEWPGEVMGVGRDGKIGGDGAKSHTLYMELGNGRGRSSDRGVTYDPHSTDR